MHHRDGAADLLEILIGTVFDTRLVVPDMGNRCRNLVRRHRNAATGASIWSNAKNGRPPSKANEQAARKAGNKRQPPPG
jgi:hypothetical protein